MDIDVVFEIPSFVKTASAELLDADQEGALVIQGFRIDNPAAAWTASATLRKMAMEDPSFFPEPRLDAMVKQACDLFRITDDMFSLNPVHFDKVMVKVANENALFTVGNQEDYEEVVGELLRKRASASYAFCSKCAKDLMSLGESRGYELPDSTMTSLRKMAGYCPVDFERGAEEINKRCAYARSIGMEKEASILQRFADICMDSKVEAVVPHIIESLDDFDRSCKVMTKSATADFKFPEDAFYMTPEEAIRKYANEDMELGDGLSVKRGALLAPEAKENISKWASDCGYHLSENASPDEIVDLVSRMPESLKKEFVGGL